MPGCLGIVDGLGLKGSELRRLLPASGLEPASVRLLDRAERRGTLAEYADEPVVVEELNLEGLAQVDTLLVCGCEDQMRELLPVWRQRHRPLIDLVGGLDVDGEARVVLAGVNDQDLTDGWLFRLPHPGAALLATLIGPFRELGRVVRVESLLFEPAAARGEPGIEQLHGQTVSALRFQPDAGGGVEPRLAFNLVPESGAERRQQEDRIRQEMWRLLGPSAGIVETTLVRVPVFHGYAAHVSLELEEEAVPQAVVELFSGREGVEVTIERPATPGELAHDPDGANYWVSVADGPPGDHVRLWVVCDLLRRAYVASAVALLGRLL